MEQFWSFFDESKSSTIVIVLQMGQLNKSQRKLILDCIWYFLGIQGT